MTRRLTLVGFCSLLFLTIGPVGPEMTALAQDPNAGRQIPNIFLPAPRDLTQRLNRARKAIDDERFSDAVTDLGQIVVELDEQAASRRDETNLEAQDYFLGSRGEGGSFTSLKTEAQRLLGAMPAKGREWYELQFGAQARALLDEAVQKGDAQKLSDASRLFFHTKAGYEATMLLGRYHMDHGRPLAAALCFKRVAESPSAAGAYEPELSLMLATCWLYANMPEKIAPALTSLEKRNARMLQVGGRQVELPKASGESRDWIERLVGKPTPTTAAGQTQWVMFRGNATRTASSIGDMPLGGARWRVPTVNNPNDEELVKQAAKKFAAQGVVALPNIHPLVIDDVVMMRTPERLVAVDFRTGKRIWVYPWDDSASEDVAPSGRGQNVANNRMQELQQRIWEDSPYGQLSSDGNFVYLLDEMGYASPNGAHMQFIVMPRGGVAANRGMTRPYNQLVALEIKTQGKIQWKIGDSDGQDEPKLAGAFFLGPPLPLQGQLYVLAEMNGEIRLVVLNARTGQLVWQQQLAHLDNRTIQVDSGRRLAGASPSFADGVLVCPTSAGAVIAVDVSNRTLLWGYQYGHTPPENQARAGIWRGGMQVTPPRPIGQRWIDATVTIVDGRVLVTPAETDELYCLDLLSGKLLWPARKREESLFLAGVHQGQALLVGKTKLTAFRLADGSNAWKAPLELPKSATVAGRGFQQDGDYFVPTSGSQILQIDLAKGVVAKAADTELPLGNLVCYQDEVLAQGVQHLSSYLVAAPLRKRVAEALQKNADDSWALARLGELQFHDGRRQESLDTLRKAHRLAPDDDATRTLLVKSLLGALRDDFARNRSAAAEVETLIEQPVQRLEYLRLMADGLLKTGDAPASFAAFLRLIAANGSGDESTRTEQATLETIDAFHSVRRDRWIRARLAELYVAAGAEQRRAMDDLVAAEWAAAKSQTNVGRLRLFVEYFGFHPLADQATLELASRLVASEELLAAQLLLARLEHHSDPLLAGAATWQLARLLAAGKQLELAAIYYQRLGDKFADVPVAEGRTGRQWRDDAFHPVDPKNNLPIASPWAYGRIVTKEEGVSSSPRFQQPTTVHPVTLHEVRGPAIPSLNVVWDPQRNQSAVIRDGLGREVLNVPLARPDGRMQFVYYNAPVHQARVLGHLMVLQIGPEVVALSLLKNNSRRGSSDAILWREDLQQLSDSGDGNQMRSNPQSRTLAMGVNRSMLVDQSGRRVGALGPIRDSGVYYQRLREVVCADPITGETIWTRGGIEFGADLFADEERLFVVAPTAKEAIVLSAIDGREIGRRPIAAADSRLAVAGRNVLSVTPQNNQLELRLTDAWTGDAIYRGLYPTTSKATLVGPNEFAVMQPEGMFEVLSLVDGQLRVRTALDPETSLDSIRVFPSQDNYLLLTLRNPTTPHPSFTIHGLSGGMSGRIFSGRVYAFDRATGKSQWQSPATFEHFGVAEDQPSEIPVFTLLRHMTPKSGASRNATKTSVLCIDKRDGRLLLQNDNINGPSHVYEIVGDEARKSVTVAVPSKTFKFSITDEPAAPEPPAQVGIEAKAAAATPAKTGATAGGALGALFQAIGPPIAGVGKPLLPPAKPPRPAEKAP